MSTIDVRDKRLTRTAKYMFFIELSMYHLTQTLKAFEELEPQLHEEFDIINVYIDDENSKDYDVNDQINQTQHLDLISEESLKELNDNIKLDFYYHILVDTTNPRFEKALDTIRVADSFIDCYQCGHKNSGKAIIRMKVFAKRRMLYLMRSMYSYMFAEREYSVLTNDRVIGELYSYYDDDYVKTWVDSIHVLGRTEELLEKMIAEYGITDDTTIRIMRENELDSKFKLEDEIINSKLII